MSNETYQKKKVGNYILLSVLGQGQFGQVFKACLDTDKTQIYAIKCIGKQKLNENPMLNQLFQTEMAVMTQTNHPNVLHLYEYMETQNNFYLVLTYCNNGDLENYLKKQKD